MRFASLLDGHRRNGTRPAAATGEPWTYAGLAAEIPSGRANEFVSPRSVSNWCKGTSLPDEIEPILRALFGPSDRHAAARSELRSAFQAARDEKAARILAKAKTDPAGGQWVIEDDQFVLDRSLRPTDQRAAKDPLRRQLQAAILRHAADLAERARRVGNTRSWGGLGDAAARFHAALQGEPRDVLDRLGDAYASLLELGSFLETDIRLQNDPARFDDPLDADIQGVLSTLVRTAAPWLRGFPTVARWDDEAGKALLRADLFQPAREFIRINRKRQAIPERDAAEIVALAETAETVGFQGHKAGTRAVGQATNLLLAEATAVAVSRIGNQDEAALPITARALSTLSAAQAEVEAFSAHWPPDLRLALRAILEDRQDHLGVSPAASLPAAVPDDVEKQAAALILQGQSPPAAWRPFIRNLDFSFQELGDVAPLAGLTSLQTLDLSNTQVTNVAPLAAL
ncbi:leucine-rich repeat domain-containing protein, partial [Methylobacterium aquaticum]